MRWEGYRAPSRELEGKPKQGVQCAAARRARETSGNSRERRLRSGLFAASAAMSACSDRGMNRLDLVMIVRDEARCLERCLASARPWVDGIVVLDTGSVDATVEIARRHGARVAHFEWIDDFAAARNAALAESDAALAAGARCRRMDRRSRRVACRPAPAGAGLHRPGPRRQPVRCVRRRRRRGAELAAAAAAARRLLYRHASTSSPRARCRAGACRSSSATTAISMRRRRARPAATSACSAWRSRPIPRTPIFTISSARTSSWARASSRPSRTTGSRSSAATRAPAGATTSSCGPCSR